MIALNFQPLQGEEVAINNLFGNPEKLIAGNGVDDSDQIQIWDGTAFSVYFYRAKKTTGFPQFPDGPAWVAQTKMGTVTDKTIKPGSGIWFFRPKDLAPAKDTLTVSGSVNAAPATHDLLGGLNMISSAFPCDMKLNDGPINWAECGAIAGNGVDDSDQIQVWDGTAFSVYFYRAKKTTGFPQFPAGPAWVSQTSMGTVSPYAVPAGRGFWYKRPAGAGTGTLLEKSPLAK